MKVNELRIGNLVDIGYDCKVVRIDEFGATLNTYKGVKDLIYFHQTDIRPIPTTEEWLVKLGFEKNKTGESSIFYQYGVYQFEFMQTGALVSIIGNRSKVLTYQNYVHQLQNLYHALTGQELTIKTTTT